MKARKNSSPLVAPRSASKTIGVAALLLALLSGHCLLQGQVGVFSKEHLEEYTPDWKGEIGFVPTVVDKAAPSSRDTVAVVCGPPVMIKFTFPVLARLGFAPENIFTTLENRMKCGVGKCGRCNTGKVFVCKDGPVFTFAQLQGMPQEY